MSFKSWPPDRNYPDPPNPELARWFQDQLTAIAGVVFGQYPRLKLFWGQSMREADRYPGSPSFDGSGMLQHRYSVRTVHTGWVAHFPEGDKTYPPTRWVPEGIPEGVLVERTTREDEIGIPRYYVHQWRSHTIEDEATYEEDRKATDPDTGKVYHFGPADLGPGQWSKVAHIIISDPTGGCCVRARELGTKCFHEYREPAQIDLDYLAAMWREKEREPVKFMEGELAPPSVVEARTQARLNQIADVAQRERAERFLRLRNVFKSDRTRLFHMPFVAVPSNFKEN